MLLTILLKTLSVNHVEILSIHSATNVMIELHVINVIADFILLTQAVFLANSKIDYVSNATVKGVPSVKLDFLSQMANVPHVQILLGAGQDSVTNKKDAQNAKLGII